MGEVEYRSQGRRFPLAWRPNLCRRRITIRRPKHRPSVRLLCRRQTPHLRIQCASRAPLPQPHSLEGQLSHPDPRYSSHQLTRCTWVGITHEHRMVEGELIHSRSDGFLLAVDTMPLLCLDGWTVQMTMKGWKSESLLSRLHVLFVHHQTIISLCDSGVLELWKLVYVIEMGVRYSHAG